MPNTVPVYFDYKSPYAYLAKAPAYALEQEFDVVLDWLPYTLDIPKFLGSVEERNDAQWRRVRYSYLDARRMANKHGLTVLGPKKIFDTRLAHIGALFAKRQSPGAFRAYHDRTFELFWKRQLDIESREAITGVLREAGAQLGGFAAFADGEGGAEHDRLKKEAEAAGVFGVPSYVVDGELYWGGDRLPQVCERLETLGVRRK